MNRLASVTSLRSRGGLAALLLAGMAASRAASADSSIIRRPGDNPRYQVELEALGSIGPWDPPGGPPGAGLGVGVRASIPITHNGFVRTINNSVAIGFGGDIVDYIWRHEYAGGCVSVLGNVTCASVNGRAPDTLFVYFPVVMQWNFWLSEHWSVFPEIGFTPFVRTNAYGNYGTLSAAPVFFAGGRYRFNKTTALTMRLGWPLLTIGVSFFLG